tara:strand:+ start:29 stop:1576 length:1548 start_codon:yes stop_codon:yes gene_type:complete
MANGILDLETDDNKQDENLFLSAPEQTGLEAATFATAIGAAPSTGNIFGDLLSVAAQTGPAALATFKERQSIKEKEAEYKTKMATNLAKKIKGQFVYDTLYRNPPKLDKDGNQVEQPMGGNVYVLNSELAKAEGTGRYQPVKKEPTALNVTKYTIIERVPDGQGGFKFVKDVVKKSYDEYTKDRLAAENNPDITVKLYEEEKNYFDTKNNEVVTMTPSKAAEGNLNEKNRFLFEPPESLAIQKQLQLKKQEELISGQDKVRKEYYAASNLADVYMNIVDDLQEMEAKGIGIGTGNFGGFMITLDNISGGVNEIFKSVSQQDENFRANYEKAAQKVEFLINEEKGVNNSIAQYLSMDPKNANMAQRSQTVRSMLTQFVYAVAKSRESGGKFSVSDIDFAFMSAGQGGNPKNILRGMSAVIEPILEDKIRQAKAYFKNEDGTTMTDEQLWRHKSLGSAQNVLKTYFNLNGKLIPAEWMKYDNSPDASFKETTEEKKQKKITIINKMRDRLKRKGDNK